MLKKIPVGFEDVKAYIDEDLYYVDKTFMIKELLDTKTSVNLLTRPKRFGKTLNLSMLRRFFEKEINVRGKLLDNGYFI